MTGEVIELKGARAPAADLSAAPAERDLNDPRYWIEPAIAPMMISNLRPRVTVAGGFATIWFAAREAPLPCEQFTGDLATVQAKICIPAAMLQDYAIALAMAAGGRLVTEKSGGGDGEND